MTFFKKNCSIKDLLRKDVLKKGDSCSSRNRAVSERALLEAAQELFAQKGYESTRTFEIAKRAGVNEALINRYYGGKEGLLKALLLDPELETKLLPNQCTEAIKIFSEQSKDTASLQDALNDFFIKSAENMHKQETFLRIYMSRALVDESIADSMRNMILDRKLPELEKGIRSLTKKANLSPDELQAITMLVGASNFALNFLSRRVHRMNEKKITLALSILAEAIDQYVAGRVQLGRVQLDSVQAKSNTTKRA